MFWLVRAVLSGDGERATSDLRRNSGFKRSNRLVSLQVLVEGNIKGIHIGSRTYAKYLKSCQKLLVTPDPVI